MANQRIASALSHQDDTTGFVPGAGYEEGNMSFSTDAIVVDIEASLDCLYGGEVDLDWEQMLAPVSLGEGILFNACDASEADISNPQTIVDTCACAQSTYWASVGGVDCSVLPTMYFYHPDYLGSVEFVTDMSGDPYQFFFNTIWGENLQNQLAYNTTAFSSRFRFNGKEWDEETGNFYYGARYYDPKISVWLSVDPLAEDYPFLSPYTFVANNPLMLIDPDGKRIVVARPGDYNTIQSYMDNQFGAGVFYVDKNGGRVKIDKKLYKAELKAAKASGNTERVELLKAFRKAVKTRKHTAEVYVYQKGQNVNIYKNPQVWDPTVNKWMPMYQDSNGNDGFTIKGAGPNSSSATIDRDGINTIILVTDPNDQFSGVDRNTGAAGKTPVSPSSIMLHEVLDHFYEENIKGNPLLKGKPVVKWHNKALINQGSNIIRDGSDHP